ncbi:MAG: response regulator [Nitrospirae bacterium]|nr:MAG: response regulator [Nitrospirota bacterium]
MSILLVDDSAENLLLLQSILQTGGYKDLLTAESAEQAFKHLGMDSSGGDGTNVDLILLDIQMPDINGIETCRRIKEVERYRDIPIIMVTAMAQREKLQLAFAAGAMDYINKPVNKIELRTRVGSALKLKQEMDSRKAREQELKKRTQELEQALREVKVLRGFIPICASCKKIRNDRGYWQLVEAYIREHSEAEFSHGICPDCIKKFFPGVEPG